VRAPSSATMLLGHPVLFWGTGLTTLGLFALGINDPSCFLLMLPFSVVAQPVFRASAERQRYLEWKHEWDALAMPTCDSTRSKGTVR
jgi:hypothetical protein